MRFHFLLFLLLVLLAACSKTDAPVRLDFVGATGLTSSNRTVSPADTLMTRAYAVGNDQALTHLRITVRYEPTRNPIRYPASLVDYDPADVPNDDELVYLDSVITPIKTGKEDAPRGGEFILQNRFTARATSGTERWRYTVTDATGQIASRAYRLTVRNPDSLAVFHRYTALLRPVAPSAGPPYALRDQARVFLNLRSGLLLPRYAVLNTQQSLTANQELVDLVCTTDGNAIRLAAAAAQPRLLPGAARQRTRLVSTTLTAAQFDQAATTAAFAAAYQAGQPFTPDSLSTGALVAPKVLAFKTREGYTGLLLVASLTTGTSPLLTCTIKVQK